MKKLFKFLLWLLAILIVLVVAIYLTAGIWLKSAVSTLVPQMTKTPASLEKADISLLSGRISFKGLKIGNPAGFVSKNAFELGEISVKFEPKSLFSSKIVINEIKIDGTKIAAELARTGNVNLMILNDNIQEYLGNPTSRDPLNSNKEKQKKIEKKSEKTVLVKDLKITNSSLDFAVMTQKMKVKLPDIQQKNIGEKKKETLPDLVADIFSALSASSMAEMAKAGRDSVNKMLDDLAGRSKEASSFVKSLKAEMKNMF